MSEGPAPARRRPSIPIDSWRSRTRWVVGEPHRAFLALALVCGPVLVLVNPPFQGADEGAHLRRAYQVAEGETLARVVDQRVGGDLPASLGDRRFRPFSLVLRHHDRRLGVSDYAAAWSVALNPEERRFIDFNNTALYSPVPYAPQALVMAIGRGARARPLALLYLARLAGLATWIALTWAAIRAIPTGKWLLAALALSPASLSVAAAVSADGLTNALAFLTMALLLELALWPSRPLAWRDVARITAVTVPLALSKFVYVTLATLLLAVPAARAGSRRRYASMAAVVLGLTAVAWLAWTVPASHRIVPYDEYHPGVRDGQALVPGANPRAQLAGVLQHPVEFVGRVSASIVRDQLWLRFASWIDWDVVLPPWFAWSWLALLVAVALAGGGGGGLSPGIRWLLAGIATASVVLIYAIHYCTWTPVGAAYVAGVSGRYLIPVAPALLLALCPNRRFTSDERLGAVLVPCVLASHVVTLWALVNRYFVA